MTAIRPVPLPPLTASNKDFVAKGQDPMGTGKRLHFSQSMLSIRNANVRRWYEHGGDVYVQWVKKFYRTSSGEPLRWDEPYLHELYLANGTPWLEKILWEKASQLGFTEMMVSFAAFAVSQLRAPVGFGVEQDSKLSEIGPRIQMAFDYIQPIQTLRAKYKESTGREDIDVKTQKTTVAGISVNMFCTSTTAANKAASGGGRQASSRLSSFPANVIIGDELDLWPLRSVDVARSRQNACPWPTKPFRAGSTPGGQGGTLDTHLRSCKYLFQWHILCPHCGEAQFLDPYGNLLKPVLVEEDGLSEIQYVDALGRPRDWFYRDGSTFDSKISTTFIGCQKCGDELDKETLRQGSYYCIYTGVKLTELCERITKEQRAIKSGIAIRYPKMATVLFDAVDQMRDLMTTMNTVDCIQQGLGKTISLGGGKMNINRLMRCVGMELPDTLGEPTMRVLGLDQGHAANWVVIQNWWMNEKEEDLTKRWRSAYKETIFFGKVPGGFEAIDRLVEDYDIDLVGMDGEPEVGKAGDYARAHPAREGNKGQVYLFDQAALKGEPWRKTERDIQGVAVLTFRLHRTFFLDAVRERLYRGLHRLPPGLTLDLKDKDALMTHYQTSERTADDRWIETPGEPDHGFHADNFCEAVVITNLFEPGVRGFSFGLLSR